MPRYAVNHTYTASRDGRQFGPWHPGHRLELAGDDAAWVQRDSPGTLTEEAEEAQAPAAEQPQEPAPDADDDADDADGGDDAAADGGEAAEERTKAPARNRQRRGGANRGA